MHPAPFVNAAEMSRFGKRRRCRVVAISWRRLSVGTSSWWWGALVYKFSREHPIWSNRVRNDGHARIGDAHKGRRCLKERRSRQTGLYGITGIAYNRQMLGTAGTCNAVDSRMRDTGIILENGR